MSGAFPATVTRRNRLGRLAQRESTRFTRVGSLVQSQYRPPFLIQLHTRFARLVFRAQLSRATDARRIGGAIASGAVDTAARWTWLNEPARCKGRARAGGAFSAHLLRPVFCLVRAGGACADTFMICRTVMFQYCRAGDLAGNGMARPCLKWRQSEPVANGRKGHIDRNRCKHQPQNAPQQIGAAVSDSAGDAIAEQ